MNSMSDIVFNTKKVIFFSQREEILHIILFLNNNNGCTRKEIRKLFDGNDSSVWKLTSQMYQRGHLNKLNDKNDRTKDIFYVTEKGLQYLERKKVRVE